MPIAIKVTLKELDNNEGNGGLEIEIPGTVGDPTTDPKHPVPIFLEYYNGQLRLVVWNGDQDPEIHEIKLRR